TSSTAKMRLRVRDENRGASRVPTTIPSSAARVTVAVRVQSSLTSPHQPAPAARVLSAMIASEVAAASAIGIARNPTIAGTIRTPPPTLTRPVRVPTAAAAGTVANGFVGRRSTGEAGSAAGLIERYHITAAASSITVTNNSTRGWSGTPLPS